MSKYKELAKNTGIFAVANFSSRILIFILVPIYTRVLSTADYGYYDLVYSTIQLLLPIITLNVSESVMRFLLSKESDRKSIFTIGVRSIVVGSLLLSLGLTINLLFNFSELTSAYSLFIWIFFVFYALNNLLVQFAKGISKVFEMAVASFLGTFSMVAFNILFLIVFNWGLDGFFLANIACFLIPTVYLIVKLKLWTYLIWEYDRSLQTEMFKFSVPLILNTLSWWVNNTSDRYIVTFISGVGANGLISVAYKIPQILTTFSAIFIQAWQISAIKESEEKSDNSFTSTLFLDYCGLLSILASILILFVQPLATIMFGNDFYSAWKFVPFLILSSLFNAAAGYVGAILTAQMNTRAMARSATYGMLVNIILNIILAIIIGPQGITIATMISSYIIFEIRRRGTIESIGTADNRVLKISWLVLILESVIMVYSNYWYLGGGLVIVLLIIYKNRLSILAIKVLSLVKK
ncbi:lipopolysaccharide biosynthesis protein [Streptococcus suis]